MSRLKIAIWVTTVAGTAVLASVAGICVSHSRSNRIFPAVTISGIPVGGLTRKQAADKVADRAARWAGRKMVLTVAGKRWTASLRELGLQPDIQKAVELALAVGHKEGLLRRVAASLGIGAPDIALGFKLDKRALDTVIHKIAQAVNVPHKDAKIHLVGGRFEIERESPGVRVDEIATRRAVLVAAEGGRTTVQVATSVDPPAITARHLRTIDTVLGTYTTYFPAWRRARTHNIIMAVNRIDGTVVMPGEVFSYNKIVGPRDKALGFRDAPIFRNGMLVPGTGGGVCQVSSTLYNAALLANMKIVQRSHHSSQVPYVSKGRDATVAYGLLDLKFRNTASSPIYIAAAVRGSRLTTAIYGSKRDKVDVSLEVVPGGKRSVTVYRVVKKDGKMASRELVSRDTYKPAIVPRERPG